MGQATGFGQNSTTNTTGVTNTTSDYNKKASFDPRANAALTALQNGTDDTSKYNKSVLAQGDVSPYTNQLVTAQNALADQAYAQGLKQTRSSGYGGGVGADSINQNKLAANYANTKASNQANLYQGAYENSQAQKQAAAASQQNALIQFLSMLRGESGTGSSVGVSNETAKMKGKTGQLMLS